MLAASAEHMASAREWFERALAADPSSLDATSNLVQACLALHDTQAACEQLTQALERHCGEALATLIERGERFAVESLERRDFETAWRLSRGLVRAVTSVTGLSVLARCLRSIDARSAPHEMRSDLLLCFAADSLDHRDLARPAALCLEVEYRWIRQPPEVDVIETAVDTGFADDDLLNALLTRSINVSPVFEDLLRALRRAYLESCVHGIDPGPQSNRLVSALAIQCFSNEYVWSSSDDEETAAQMLAEKLVATHVADIDDRTLRALVIVACYRPMTELRRSGLASAVANAQAPWLRELVSRVIDEPRMESELAATLEVTSIADETSRAVQAHYEHAPYPRWMTLEPEPEDTVSGHLTRLFPNLRPPAFLNAPVDILIAGCGTGEHALRVARRHPQCLVHALDLSRSSLGYAMRKARELGIDNVRFVHGDLLTIGEEGHLYPVIESVGVLHHMRNPGAGLNALVRALTAGGVIKLGLYSRAGRRDVRTAWQRIQALGLARGDEHDVRTFRQRILDGEEPELKALARSDDFYTSSNVRDLLFHVQEHQFTLTEVQGLIDAAGVMLIGFQPPERVRQRYVARYANDPWLQSMENLARFEREHPLAFAGMYQFWCFKPPG